MANMDWFVNLQKKDPKAVKAWVDATYRNRAAGATAPLAGRPVLQGYAKALTDLSLNLQGVGFQHQIDYETQQKQARANMLAQFAGMDKNLAAQRAASNQQLANFAKSTGMQSALQNPAIAQNNRLLDQFALINQGNRANQLASMDQTSKMYDDLLGRQAQGYDTMAAQNLSSLYDAIVAADAAKAASAGRGGGGGGGRRRSGPTAGPAGMPNNQVSVPVYNPYDLPSGHTGSGDYVKPDVPAPHWVPPAQPAKKQPMATKLSLWKERQRLAGKRY